MALDISRVQAVCFDVDGTLSDTDDQWAAAVEHRLTILSRVMTKDRLHLFARWAIMCAETPGNLVYHLLDRADLDDEVGRFYSYLCQRSVGRKPKKYLLIEGVREMLQALCGRYPMAVVSARDETSTLAFLRQWELDGLFQVIATACTCRYTKPFPDPVRWAAAQMGVLPVNCLMVGDTTADIRAGRSAGAQTVGVLCGFGRELELRRAGADMILHSTAELAGILAGANQAAA